MTNNTTAGAKDPFKVLEAFGVVLYPQDSEPPVLTAPVRAALKLWMTELNYERELKAVGVKPRTRMILEGPPGTGKTTLAHHIAARLGVPLAVIEVSNLISKYVGETGNNIGKVFAAARALKGDVALFFDEIDSVGTARSSDGSSAGQSRVDSVVALLQMIDRYDGVLFAATNRPQVIDAAIWRRFEMQINVGLPGPEERFAIVRRYFAPFHLPDEDIGAFGDVLDQASPALIRTVVEQVKREIILAPKLEQDGSLPAILERVTASAQPAEDMPRPTLWARPERAEKLLSSVSWPPERKAA